MEIQAKYTDINLKSVRDYVGAKKSSVPILLMPVRIETRFMQVERADVTFIDAHLVGELLELFYDLETTFIDYNKKLNASEQKRLLQITAEKIKELKTTAKKLGKITKEQKTWLEDASNSAIGEAQAVAKNISRIFAVKFKAELVVLQSVVKSLNASAPTKTEKTLDFVKEMTALEKKLAVFSSKQPPYTGEKNKKKLYKFVTGRIAEVKNFYKHSTDKVESLVFVEENLVHKISGLHQKISSQMLNLGRTIKPFLRDENWKNFADANTHIIQNEYVGLFKNFENKAIKHLQEVQKMDVIDANKFLVQSLAMSRAFKKFSKLDITSYGEIKKMRKHLTSKMDVLKKLKTKVITGNDFQKEQIKNQLLEIDKKNLKLADQLDHINTGNNSIRFGVNTTKKVLSEVSKFSLTNASNIKITNRKSIADGSKTMSRSINAFEQMVKNFVGNNRIGNFQNNKMDSVLHDTKVSLRKGYQITDADYKKLASQLNQVKSKSQQAVYENPQIKRESQLKMANLELALKDLKKQVLAADKVEGIQFVVPKKLKEELWLRIYPDDLFVNTHEKSMTQGELDSGKRYWNIVWAVDNDKELVMGAWRSLVASYGNGRAAWIAKTIGAAKRPKNNHITSTNPSKDLIKAINELEAVQKALKPVKSDFTLKQLNQKINFAKINLILRKVIAIYGQLKNKPQLLYFLEKNISVQQRIHSKFQIVVEIMNKAEMSTGNQTIIEVLKPVLKSFEKLHTEFEAIKAVRTDQFLDQISEPYTYPNIAALKPKEESWTAAPHTKVLPKQFVAIGKNNGEFEIIHVGKTIPENLQLGMNPGTFNFENEIDNPFQLDANGDLKVKEGMRWMVDFDEAVSKGMGMIVPLTTTQAKNGFDELYVLGLNDTTFTNDASKLEGLLENHHFSPNGLEFLKIGTPTNNTEDVKAGFSYEQLSAEESFALEMEDALFDASTATTKYEAYDGQHLADTFGISDNNFKHIKNSNLRQIGNARAMHKSLWHSTLGVYMEDMWDKVFTYDNIERTYQFFTEHVVGRGSLPSIRIGSQPYGILPVTSFKNISFSNTFSEADLPKLSQKQLKDPKTDVLQKRLQFRYDVRLKQLLGLGNDIYSKLREAHVNHAGKIGKTKDPEGPQAAFVNMLGLTATSTEFYFRYGVNINDRTADNLAGVGINFKDDEDIIYSPQSLIFTFNKLIKEGYFYPSYEFQDETNPSLLSFIQSSRKNSRMRDQINTSRIFTYRYLDRHSLVAGPLVSETENEQTLPTIIGDSQNYIQWLLDPGKHVYSDIFNDNDLENLPSQSILFLLLRQSMLLSYREAALNILQKDGFFEESFRRIVGSKEVYMSRDNSIPKFRTKWTHLLKRIKDLKDPYYFDSLSVDAITSKPLYKFLSSGSSNESLSDYIHNDSYRNRYNGRAKHAAFIDRTKNIKEAIGHLSSVATEDLSTLLAEHLDVSSYRLDAWISGLANRRLEESRAIQKNGIFLGAYAWVENLRPGGDRSEVAQLPEGFAEQGGTVYTDADNEGYIHAPSINHAISAAILRSGYLANDEAEGDLTNRMAVNLSSARVRKAMQLINGLRNGLDLPSLLGYQFEKGIHERYQEAELDKFIYPLRKRYPLIVPIRMATQDANQATANVVHGLNLLEAVTDTISDTSKASQSSLYDYLVANNFENCPAWLSKFVNDNSSSNATDRKKELTAIIKEIDEMADTFDALGDVAISESVYQIVNGNHVRAASMLAALGDGTIMPEPQIVNTPRTGRVVTHKVIMHFEEATGKPANWISNLTPRANAEPALNHWLAKEIGNPDQYFCKVVNTETAEEFNLQLSELSLQPIDLLFFISSNKDKGNADLLDLIMDKVRLRERLDASIVLNVAIKTKAEIWPENAKTFFELDWLLAQCKSIFHDARPINFSDISIPAENPDVDNPDKYDLPQLQTRVNQIHGDLKQFLNVVNDFLVANISLDGAATFQKAYQHLTQASQYAITSLLGNLSRAFDEEEGKVCIERLKKAVELLEQRKLTADGFFAKANAATSTQQKAEELIKIPKTILGEDFPFIPAFKNEVKNEIEQQLQLNASQSLLRASDCTFPMEEWLQGIANVRTKMYAIEMLSMSQSILGPGISDLKPVQFPHVEGDYWLGIEYPESYEATDDKLSLVLLNPQIAIGNQLQKGLLIDEWVEVIPNYEETTGVAFQYDQPDATAPQTILLAVSPKPVTTTSKWEWDDLVHTLVDTLEMAKNRTVEPDQLEQSKLGQVLPAIISEVEPPQISDALDTDDDDPHKNLLGVQQVVLDYEANLPNEEN